MKISGEYSRPRSFSEFLPRGPAMAAAILVLLLTPSSAFARGKPQIVQHEASFLEQSVVIVLQWQSPNPVVRVTAHVGGQKQVVEVDPYDNRRNQDGYWGEVTVEVQAGQPSGTDGIPYILQVEDDLRQKSERIKGKVRVAAARPPEGAEDTWGRQHLERPGLPGPGGQPPPYGTQPPPYGGGQYPPYGGGQYPPYGEGQYPPYGAGPTIQLIDVSVYGGQVTITLQAFDQSGLQLITFRIYDMAGALLQEQQIPPQGPEFYGPTEPITLPPGNYRVSAQAVGSSGTPSPEDIRDFVVGNEGTVAVEPPAGTVEGYPESSWDIPQDQWGGEPGAVLPGEESAIPSVEEPVGQLQKEESGTQEAEKVSETGSEKPAETEPGTTAQQETPPEGTAGIGRLPPRKPVVPLKPVAPLKPVLPMKPVAEKGSTTPAGDPGGTGKTDPGGTARLTLPPLIPRGTITIPSPKGTGPGVTVKLPAGGEAPAIEIPGKGTIVASTTTVRPVELKNDGHVADRPAKPFGEVVAGDEIAAVLGPMPQPFRVIGVSVLCTGPPAPGSLTLKIYEDVPGKNFPGKLLYSAKADSKQAGSSQVALDLSGRTVVVPAGRVWIAVRHKRAGLPGVAIDADGPAAGRNWLYRAGRWQEFGALKIAGDAVIRAAVIPR